MMEIKNYFLLLILWLGGWQVFSQFPPTVDWKYTYPSPASINVAPQAMEHNPDGSYIIAGRYSVLKIDSRGKTVWSYAISRIGPDVISPTDVRRTSDGGYIVTGQGGIGGNSFPCILKLSATGKLLWRKNHTSIKRGGFHAIQQTTDGGYIAAGSVISGKEKFLIVKTGTTGNLQWQKTYGKYDASVAYDIKQTTDGGYIVMGYTDKIDIKNRPLQGHDIWVIKLFSNGSLDWEKTYGGSDYDNIMGSHYESIGNDVIRQTTDGGYIFVCGTKSTDGDVGIPRHGGGEVWLVKLKANGTIDWEKTYGGSSEDSGNSVQQTLDGGYIVGAYSLSKDGDLAKNNGKGSLADLWVFKTDSLGRFRWGRSLGGRGDDPAVDIAQVSGCEYTVLGRAWVPGGDISKGAGYWVINFDVDLPPPATDSLHAFCWRDSPKIKDLEVNGSDSLGFPIKFRWYKDTTDVYALADTTMLKNGQKYYVTQTIDGCESPYDSTVVRIVQDILPKAASPQSFCGDESPSIAGLAVTGQNLRWYRLKPDTLEIPESTPLEDGETYYVSQSIEGCQSSLLPITVEVFPPPDAFPLSAVFACDTDGNGSGEFFLPDLDDKVSGGATNVAVTYHASLSAAENGTGVLPDNYSTQSSPESIYARVVDTTTGCDSVAEVELVVSPVPEIVGLEDLTGCDDGNGQAVFDLTQNNPNILGNQNAQNLKITYHTSQSEAENGQNAIPGPENYISGPRDIFVRLENGQTGCFDTGSFKISVDPRPAIATLSIQEEFCSDMPGGDVATIDLTGYDSQINPGNPVNTKVVYYANANAHAAGEAIENPEGYTTMANPQTITAETINTGTGCPSLTFVEIEIRINDRPIVDLSQYDGRAICWDSNAATPVQGGNYQAIILETGLDEAKYDFEWALNGENLPGNGSSIEATEPGKYEVRVSDTDGVSTTCTSTSMATIIEANPPEFMLTRLTGAVANPHSILVSEVTGIGSFEFRVDDGEWLPLGSDGNLLFENVPPGTHIVYGRSLEGCGTTVKTITVIGYPKFFTPNNDGQNDRWNIIGLQEGEVYIFDRYGKLLQSLDPQNPGWNGTYNGHIMPADDYWFKVKFTEQLPDGSERPGEFAANFSLIR